MTESTETPIRRPVRRRKTKMEILKESYLPCLILFAAAVLILIFIIGAVNRNAELNDAATAAHAAIFRMLEC